MFIQCGDLAWAHVDNTGHLGACESVNMADTGYPGNPKVNNDVLCNCKETECHFHEGFVYSLESRGLQLL